MVDIYTNIKIDSTSFYRTFSKDVDVLLLKWHTDTDDRIVTILDSCDGWLFQFDNELPIQLTVDMILEIPKNKFHRLIKLNVISDLKLQINLVLMS